MSQKKINRQSANPSSQHFVKQSADLSVGEVAKRCGIKVSTLHFYESKGLIQSWRNTGNQRRYSKDILRRVALIKTAQKLGISLGEIKQQLDSLSGQKKSSQTKAEHKAPTKQDWQRLANGWQQELNQRIETLERLRDYLTGCIGCGCLSMEVCPIYNHDDQLGQQGTGAVLVERESSL